MENGKKCPHCGKSVTVGYHVIAEICFVTYVFCPEKRTRKETYIDASLAKYLKMDFQHGQKGA